MEATGAEKKKEEKASPEQKSTSTNNVAANNMSTSKRLPTISDFPSSWTLTVSPGRFLHFVYLA